jgi:hypothetical protein
MPRRSISSSRSPGSSGQNGIMGSGIFGVFGTVINCNDTDTSFYCTFMKIFNFILVIFIVGLIFFLIYKFFTLSSSNSIRSFRMSR